jgi:hypothetical protein
MLCGEEYYLLVKESNVAALALPRMEQEIHTNSTEIVSSKLPNECFTRFSIPETLTTFCLGEKY